MYKYQNMLSKHVLYLNLGFEQCICDFWVDSPSNYIFMDLAKSKCPELTPIYVHAKC